MKLLKNIVNEFDPRHDFDRFTFYNFKDDSTLGDYLKTKFKNFYWLLALPKHTIRGSIVGGAAGLSASLVAGGSANDGILVGASFGSAIDILQYYTRGLIKLSKVEHSKDNITYQQNN